MFEREVRNVNSETSGPHRKGLLPKRLGQEFKTQIHAIKREAERKFIGALTKFHYRCIEPHKSVISRSKKDTDRAGETPRAQPNSSSYVPESVSNLSTILEKKLEEINVMMKEIEEIKHKTCESYPSECGTKKTKGG